eukprot:3637595-Amphidinium_carterae.1
MEDTDIVTEQLLPENLQLVCFPLLEEMGCKYYVCSNLQFLRHWPGICEAHHQPEARNTQLRAALELKG